MRRVAAATGAIALMFMTGYASAQIDPVPSTINYQGTLYKANGKTPETGPVNIEIRLYANKDDDITAAVWGESHLGKELVGGVFSVTLGTGQAIGSVPHESLDSVFAGNPLWIGVAVVGESQERQERQLFSSAPYALTANSALTAIHGVPPGTISIWGGNATNPLPAGWLPCDGESYLRAPDPNSPNEPAYPSLFAAIGAAWNIPGDPDTRFRVPNFGGRVLVGENTANAPGLNDNNAPEPPATAGLTNHSLGDLLGEESHVLTEGEMAAHTHSYTDWYVNGISDVLYWGFGADPVIGPEPWPYDTQTQATGSGVTHNNMQVSVVVRFIIKY